MSLYYVYIQDKPTSCNINSDIRGAVLSAGRRFDASWDIERGRVQSLRSAVVVMESLANNDWLLFESRGIRALLHLHHLGMWEHINLYRSFVDIPDREYTKVREHYYARRELVRLMV